MGYIQGVDRRQQQLLPVSVEEYVEADSPVRFIEEYVNGLKVGELGFEREQPAETGRPGYDPRVLLKLYVYGYLQRIRSSRRLEAEAKRNLELIWLLGGLRPDFKTIADFRRDNRKSFKGVFRDFNLMVRKLGLFGAELVAIDGAKFKAVSSSKGYYTPRRLEDLKRHLDGRIEEYLGILEQEDAQLADLPGEPSREELAQRLGELQQRREECEGWGKTMEQKGQTEINVGDPDSRWQKRVGAGYNVQVAVDGKHDLIVAEEVVPDQNDAGQLHPMATAAQEQLQKKAIDVVADSGYYQAEQIGKCEQSGAQTYVPAPRTSEGRFPGGVQVYPKSEFAYQAEQDLYRCPQGQELVFGYAAWDGSVERRYYYNVAACSACAVRALCTRGRHRKISRLPNEEIVERLAVRVAQKPHLIRERKTIVEHVFGTLRIWGHDTFLCRGLEMVRAEFSLSALSYNLRRLINLFGVEKLLAALRSPA
jgi:transposase